MGLTWTLATAPIAAMLGPWLRSRILAHTIEHGQPLRSRCEHCAAPVVPARWRGVLTPLPATGNCPHCRRRLGPPAGTVEVLAAAVTAVLAWQAPSGWILAAWC